MKMHLWPCRFRSLTCPRRTHTTLQLTASYIAATAFLALRLSANADPRPAWPPWPEPTLASYRFNDVDWHTPLLPPAIGFEDAYVQESWSEYALIRDGFSMSPVIVPNVDASGRDTFAPEMGAVRFWFCPSWSSSLAGGEGPGEYARLVEAVDLAGSQPAVRWSLYMSEDGSALYLSGVGPNGRAKDLLTGPASFVSGQWELITLNYGPEECELWVGNELLAAGDGMPTLRPGVEPIQGLVIGSDLAAMTPAGGQFEEFTTFDYRIDAEQLAFYYSGVSRQVFRGTIGSAEEEAAKEEILAAMYPQSMTFEAQGSEMQMAYSYSTNELWLEIVGVSDGVANLVLHNTEPWTTYEILSKDSLTNAGWLSETNVLAIEGQDWATADILTSDRTNSLFFRARSYADDDGDGLPSWWELENGLDPSSPDTGGTGVSDGYKDSDNDGWSNLQEYQNGTSPGGFDMPPAPQAVRARLNPTGSGALVSWVSSGSAVADYVITNDAGVSFTNSSTSVVDTGFTMPTGYYYDVPEYSVQARYAGGNSSWSPWSELEEAVNPARAYLLADAGGPSLLAINLPNDIGSIELWGYDTTYFDHTNVTLAVSPSGGSAVVQLPTWAGDPDSFFWLEHQLVRTNGSVTAAEFLYMQGGYHTGFADGRTQLLENLVFQLRAASMNSRFDLSVWSGGLRQYNYVSFPDYVQSSYMEIPYTDGLTAYVYEWIPFEANYDFRNCVYDFADVDPSTGFLTTGFDEFFWPFRLYLPSTYEFTDYGNYGTIPSVLGTTQTQWLHPGWWYTGVGLSLNGDDFEMAVNARNYYGLPLLSTKITWVGQDPLQVFTVSAGGSETLTGVDEFSDWLYFYPEAVQPQLENVGWYFAEPNGDWLPGHDSFSVTNTSPLLVTSVGIPIRVAGYAKLAIANGYADKYAYLGQYFGEAYKADASGDPTTNLTGILSPYGEFTPTEPGRVILTTLPDGVSTNIGECLIQVASLNVDANHDGVMDVTLTGPDHTSEERPFVFWVNDDYDVFERDSDTDHTGLGDHDDEVVGSERDLEDFARLWVSGLPAMPTGEGFAAVLGWRNVTGNPGIRLYRAYETNGSTAYLTDTNVALQQFFYTPVGGYGRSIGRVRPTQPMGFPSGFFGLEGTNSHFLFEGTGVGSGELVLTIAKAGNTLAELSLWVDLRDIKDMYEQVHIENVDDSTPNSLVSVYAEDKVLPDSMDDDERMIVFVHGWRIGQWDYHSFSESMFKRLYWQGYQGRFASIRWPTLSHDDFKLPLLDLFTFNKSEFRSWQSGRGIADYLTDLRERFPNHRIDVASHSMGGVPMMQALKRHLSQGRQEIDAYVLMQVAAPGHCYDTTLTDYADFVAEEISNPTPDAYRGYPGTIDDAVRQRIVNFFNTNDFALATGTVGLPVHWEKNEIDYKPDSGFGYSSDGTNAFQNAVAITDPRQIMGFVARPRSKAVGAQTGVAGEIQGGQLDLKGNFGFDLDRSEHSAQFNWNIHRLNGFYQALLDEFQ